MNRPQAKNAIGRVFLQQLSDSISGIRYQKEVRVVILRSLVDGVFCAGADLKVSVSVFWKRECEKESHNQHLLRTHTHTIIDNKMNRNEQLWIKPKWVCLFQQSDRHSLHSKWVSNIQREKESHIFPEFWLVWFLQFSIYYFAHNFIWWCFWSFYERFGWNIDITDANDCCNRGSCTRWRFRTRSRLWSACCWSYRN